MARECQMFYSRLAEMLAEKRNMSKTIVSSWLRTKICFALQKSCLLCLRGSRSLNKNVANLSPDIELSQAVSKPIDTTV